MVHTTWLRVHLKQTEPMRYGRSIEAKFNFLSRLGLAGWSGRAHAYDQQPGAGRVLSLLVLRSR